MKRKKTLAHARLARSTRTCLAICMLLLTTVGASAQAKFDKIKQLAVKCSSGDTKSCAKLAEMARTEKASDVRSAAVKAITDQQVLVGIAKSDSDWAVRTYAVGRMTDQAALTDIAVTDESSWVRLEAVKRLDDPGVLSAVLRKDKDSGVRLAAIKKITDPRVLAEVAVADQDSEVREIAVKGVDDQSVLTDIVLKDTNRDVAKAAIQKITSQNVLGDIAKGTGDMSRRKAAVERITDQLLLGDVAIHELNPVVRSAAIDKISSEAVMGDVARKGIDWSIRAEAVGKLTDQAVLAEIARGDAEWLVRNAALKKVTVKSTYDELHKKQGDDLAALSQQAGFRPLAMTVNRNSTVGESAGTVMIQGEVSVYGRSAVSFYPHLTFVAQDADTKEASVQGTVMRLQQGDGSMGSFEADPVKGGFFFVMLGELTYPPRKTYAGRGKIFVYATRNEQGGMDDRISNLVVLDVDLDRMNIVSITGQR